MSKTPKTLNSTEQTQILAFLQQESGNYFRAIQQKRNYCMVLLMLDAGLRVSEVSKLLVSDLVINGQPVKSLIVRPEVAKKNKERTIPLTARLQSAIEIMQEWWYGNAPEPTNNYAFNANTKSKGISPRQIQRIIQAISVESIGRKVNPHMLRHTFGTRLMRQTNARVVQELLGHENLSSTQIYCHPNGDDLRAAIDAIAL